jgi:CheY-like chemotaxis protein/CRP-like cAMP-binding protein
MPPESNLALSQILKKIPIFAGLSPSQVQKVLTLFTRRTYESGRVLCESGSTSDEMFVLLSGELGVLTEEGIQVAALKPVTTVGEIGIVIKQPRSATVNATTDSNILAIRKSHFDNLIREDKDIRITIYRNIIEILSHKLVNDNVRMRDILVERARHASELKQKDRRAELAKDLLVEKTELTPDDIEQILASSSEDSNLRILIADDEIVVRNFVKKALSPYEVVEAGNGVEALQMMSLQKPDLVIADIRMPEMDGLVLLSRIREKYNELPVLALSGAMSDDELREYDFDGFVSKPVRLEEFRKLVESSLIADESE